VLTTLAFEYDAVRAHLTDLSEVENPDGDIYERGSFACDARRWEVSIVEVGMGNPNAAQKIERAIAHVRPDLVLFVGVAGGIKNVAVGDVVVATKVYGYQSGKAAGELLTRPEVGLPGYRALERARAEARKPDWRKRIDDWDIKPTPTVHLGAIAAGEKLMASAQSKSYLMIRQLYEDALGVEMEGYGFIKAVQAFSDLEALVVRGISDLPEGNARPEPKRAATCAAAYAFEVLSKLSLPEKSVRQEAQDILGKAASASTPALRSTLPSQSYFFGRQKELDIIARAIHPDARTWGALIDGPGGIGKTALAIRAAEMAPTEYFPLKLFLSAKVRELTPAGEQKLEDHMLPNYQELLKELARQLGEDLGKADPNERAREVTRLLGAQRALLVIDNVETFPEVERNRLYEFLSRLPSGCKAIVTSRRRADIEARALRLDRLQPDEAMQLIAELARDNPVLSRAAPEERRSLYEIAHGNPLLIRWLAGQLGREGSRCRTIAQAITRLKALPPENDPLEYIFGDLLDTITLAETAALAALAQFTTPAKVEWVASMADLAESAARTALEDLADRALLTADQAGERYYLPPLAAEFLRQKRPEAITRAGDRLAHRATALALENGYREYERFPVLEASWEIVQAALPHLLAGENARLQKVCEALQVFLDYSGRWDERLALEEAAEQKALEAGDFYNAGWRASTAGFVYASRSMPTETLACAARCAAHWEQTASAGARQQASALYLSGLGYRLQQDYPAAVEAHREALKLWRTLDAESEDVSIGLNALAGIEHLQKDYPAAERDYKEALLIAQKVDYREGVATCTGNLAELALDRGDWQSAEALARQALPLSEALGRQELVGSQSHHLALALARLGKPAEGLPYARRAVEIFTRLRTPKELEEALAAVQLCESGWDAWFSVRPDPSQIPNIPEGVFPRLEISRLLLRNVRAFEELSIRDISRQGALLVGENTAGKSTLLSCLALALLGPELANQIERRPASYLRKGAERGFIEVAFNLYAEVDPELRSSEITVGIEIRTGEQAFRSMPVEEMKLSRRNCAEHLDVLRRRTQDDFGFFSSYGSFRTFDDPSKKMTTYEKQALDRNISLFDHHAPMTDPDILASLLSGSLANFREAPERLPEETRLAMQEHLRELLPDCQKVESETCSEISLHNVQIPFRELSDGYASLLALVGHLFRHALPAMKWAGDPAAIRGIALIDEVDAHLHPSWQRRILPDLARIFPNLQIIATTHSSMVAGSVDSKQIRILKRKNGNVELVTDPPVIEGWRADQILTSVLFDLPTTRSLETETLFNEYAALLREKGLDNPEVRQLGARVAKSFGLEGEGAVDRATHELLNQLLIERFKHLDDQTRQLVLAKAGLMAGGAK
jgi:nucleoside phosphorylase/predicted ATPase